MDPTLRDGSTSEIMRCIHIGLLCVQENVVDSLVFYEYTIHNTIFLKYSSYLRLLIKPF